MENSPVIDTHIHLWAPHRFTYPWLGDIEALNRPFEPRDYETATAGIPIQQTVFVECNCLPGQSLQEVDWVEDLTVRGTRIGAIVAFVDFAPGTDLDAQLEALSQRPRVRSLRHNIQGHAAGFCLQKAFVEGVRAVGRAGFHFELCVTHDQLGDVIKLVEQCPDVRMVLNHCGKPNIKGRVLEPWKRDIARLAEHETVVCKISGLLTECDHRSWRPDDLLPYCDHVVASFGPQRILYGSDWPVLTLAGAYADWYEFTRHYSQGWSAEERNLFYWGNANAFYAFSGKTKGIP